VKYIVLEGFQQAQLTPKFCLYDGISTLGNPTFLLYRTATTLYHKNPILFTLGLCMAGFGMMNFLSTIKTARAQAKHARVLEEMLDSIPESHLTGVNALPVELWSQIIERVLDPPLQHNERQCYVLPQILMLRLVCRKPCYT
jgi:hypothetical protein